MASPIKNDDPRRALRTYRRTDSVLGRHIGCAIPPESLLPYATQHLWSK